MNKSSYFKKLARLLREAEEAKPLLPSEEGTDSIDTQIDKYFVNYEAEAKSAKTEGLNLRSITSRFLFEAGEDEEGGDDPLADLTGDDEGGDEEGGEEGGDEEGGDEEGGDEGEEGEEGEDEEEKEPEEPKKLTSEDIDVNSFAASIARLVDNYDSLLEIRNTILRRAAAFVAKSYDQETVDSFKDVMSVDYDMDIGESSVDSDEKFPAPKAGFAGPAGGGGA